MPNNYTVLACT